MQTYIILLRGINVGGTHLLPMKELVRLLEENGYKGVSTYIQSGNIVLKSKNNPADEIGALIHKGFGFKPEIIALDKSEFSSAVSNNPYHSGSGKEIHLYFCREAPEPDFDKLEALRADSEAYTLNGKVFYLFAPQGIGRSKLVSRLESCLGVQGTGRNLNTISKLTQMVENL